MLLASEAVLLPTPGLLGACSRARQELWRTAGSAPIVVACLRALCALPARALPLP
ncbi:MAG TPA: hypothetical protein VG963_01080 [Polyangiaceae bacterium]|nr:hypothetical protein [Polyangiaceae bacterium]